MVSPLTHRSVPDAPDPAVEERASLEHRSHVTRVSQFNLEIWSVSVSIVFNMSIINS